MAGLRLSYKNRCRKPADGFGAAGLRLGFCRFCWSATSARGQGTSASVLIAPLQKRLQVFFSAGAPNNAK